MNSFKISISRFKKKITKKEQEQTMREIIFTLLALHVYNVSGTCTYYTIRPGDTCYSLGIIEAFNPHINCHMLRPGEHVCIQVHSACGPNSYMHKIQYGDTCFSLGKVIDY